MIMPIMEKMLSVRPVRNNSPKAPTIERGSESMIVKGWTRLSNWAARTIVDEDAGQAQTEQDVGERLGHIFGVAAEFSLGSFGKADVRRDFLDIFHGPVEGFALVEIGVDGQFSRPSLAVDLDRAGTGVDVNEIAEFHQTPVAVAHGDFENGLGAVPVISDEANADVVCFAPLFESSRPSAADQGLHGATDVPDGNAQVGRLVPVGNDVDLRFADVVTGVDVDEAAFVLHPRHDLLGGLVELVQVLPLEAVLDRRRFKSSFRSTDILNDFNACLDVGQVLQFLSRCVHHIELGEIAIGLGNQLDDDGSGVDAFLRSTADGREDISDAGKGPETAFDFRDDPCSSRQATFPPAFAPER